MVRDHRQARSWGRITLFHVTGRKTQTMFSVRALLFAFTCVPVLAACAREDLVDIRIDGVPARVEVAASDEARRLGLMYRRSLAADQGLLMIFPSVRPIQIWMLNVQIPLDVGFFDGDGVLLGSVSMQPDGGREIYGSPAPARYALEMNIGWFDRHGLFPGSRLQLPVSIK